MEQNPQEEVTSSEIAFVAHMKGMSEFELFKEAWGEWHVENATDKDVEPAFSRYLKYGEVPPWVRGYVRQFFRDKTILEKERQKYIIGRFIFYAPLVIFFLLFLYFALKD
jgi:hypothetical protein